jgi:hypothetical protein
MDILACTDCVRSIAGKLSYTDIFSSSNLQKCIKKVHVVYMGFFNYNTILDIDILNLETGCSKIHDDFDHVV